MAQDDVPLREYFEALRESDQRAIGAALDAAKEAVAAALAAAEKAVLKAERAAELRFDAVNEFRATLTDQAATFASTEKVDGLERRLSLIEGAKAGAVTAQTLMFAVVGLFVALVGLYLAFTR
jgi:hypothetical protein